MNSRRLMYGDPMSTSRPKPGKANGKKMQTTRSARSIKSTGSTSLNNSTKVFAPVAIGRVRKMTKPQIRSLIGSDARISVRHREYLGEITSTGTGFTNFQFPCNPGQAATFPWLSVLAANYEFYRFKNLKFCFETEASTATAGSVMLAIDYDASDAAPVSKTELMSYLGAVRTPPYEEADFTADSKDLKKIVNNHVVRLGAVPANTDIKSYDVGTFNIAISGIAAGVVGELYVEYECELETPQESISCFVC